MSDDILAALARIEARMDHLEAAQTRLEAEQMRFRLDVMARLDRLQAAIVRDELAHPPVISR